MRNLILGLVWWVMFFQAGAVRGVDYSHVIVDSREDRPIKPYIKLIGDINSDGMDDILVASAKGNGVFWYMSPAWVRKVIAREGTFSEEGKLADIDRDGDLDAVLPTKEGIFWYENRLGSHTAGEDSEVLEWRRHYIGSDGANVHDLSVGDFDNDGEIEVVARYEKELRRPLTLWRREKSGEWEAIEISDYYGEGLAVGDVDGDGLVDLVINELWFRNSEDGLKWISKRYTEGMPDQLKVVCADLDGDQRDEIIISPQSRVPEGRKARIACYFLRSTEGESEWAEITLEEGADEVNKVHGIAVGDMDLDSDPDVTTSKRHDARGVVEIAIFYNADGKGRHWEKSVVDTRGSHNHLVGDINGDGYPDLVGANWNDEAMVEAWLADPNGTNRE